MLVDRGFLPIAALGTKAVTSAVTFDLDGTLAQYTPGVFFEHFGMNPPDDPEIMRFMNETDPRSPTEQTPYFAWMSGEEWPMAKLEVLRHTPSFQRLFDDYSARNHAKTIYPRMAEEVAQAKACLHTVVLITGSFRLFTEPVLPALAVDLAEMNEKFDDRRVRGKTKPDILIELFGRKGLSAFRVYTDDWSDRHMLIDPRLSSSWQKVHVIPPGAVLRKEREMKPEFQALIDEHGWIVLNREISNPDYTAPVRDYAANVIRGYNGIDCKKDFYRRWWDVLRGPNAAFSKEALAAAGLYLKESDAVKKELAAEISTSLDLICFDLYRSLIQHDPEHLSPLELTT
jgi:phosphoserine phosphatase